jgi:hypothetical protein
MKLWDGKEHKNGDKCPAGSDEGKPASLVWTVNGKKMNGNPADHRPKNGEIIAIGLLPKGERLPEPPTARQALANIQDLGGSQSPLTIPPQNEVPGTSSPTESNAPPSS